MRTRMSGGVGAGRAILPATRFGVAVIGAEGLEIPSGIVKRALQLLL